MEKYEWAKAPLHTDTEAVDERIERRLSELCERYPSLSSVREDIKNAYLGIRECYDRGGKLLIAGNGGSCSDALHIVGELMKGFIKKRPMPAALKATVEELDPKDGRLITESLQMGLPAICLNEHQSLNSAFANDVNGDLAVAQQVRGYGRQGDVLLLISTSGNSRILMYAVPVAKALGMTVIGLTGKDGGRLAQASDIAIIAPEQETYKIQELHLPIYHCLCLMLEDTYFPV